MKNKTISLTKPPQFRLAQSQSVTAFWNNAFENSNRLKPLNLRSECDHFGLNSSKEHRHIACHASDNLDAIDNQFLTVVQFVPSAFL